MIYVLGKRFATRLEGESKTQRLERIGFTVAHNQNRLVMRMMILASLFELTKVLMRYGVPKDVRNLIVRAAHAVLLQ
jgi:hypothetical protein